MSDIDDKSYLLGVSLERERIISQVKSLINLLYPDEMTPTAKRMFEAALAGEQPVSANPDNDAASENPDKRKQ